MASQQEFMKAEGPLTTMLFIMRISEVSKHQIYDELNISNWATKRTLSAMIGKGFVKLGKLQKAPVIKCVLDRKLKGFFILQAKLGALKDETRLHFEAVRFQRGGGH